MKSILIIVREDLRTRFSEIVANAGYHVITADSSDAALQLAESISPDLVLLAIAMPHINGLQTAAQMRSLPGAKEMPIVLLGSMPPVGIEEEPLASLVNGYLGWDVPAEELVKCVAKFTGDSRLTATDL